MFTEYGAMTNLAPPFADNGELNAAAEEHYEMAVNSR